MPVTGEIVPEPDSCAWRERRSTCNHPRDPGGSLCIFHKPVKNAHDFLAALPDSIRDGVASWRGFHFPRGVSLAEHFAGHVIEADATGAIIDNGVSFRSIAFGGGSRFDCCTFADGVDFSGASFTDGKVSFDGAEFGDDTSFSHLIADEAAISFSLARFGSRTTFHGSRIGELTCCSVFGDDADFSHATVTGTAEFDGSHFGKNTDFSHASFGGKTTFIDANFGDGVRFRGTGLAMGSSFRRAVFDGRTVIGWKSGESVNDLRDVAFRSPEDVVMFDIDLRRSRLVRTDLGKIRLVNCTFATGANGKRVLFDECMIHIDPSDADVPYLIQQTYQLVKFNFESVGDYSTAGDFHCGEMEMRRLAGSSMNQRLGLLRLYKAASYFGESYQRAIVVLLCLIGGSTLVLALVPASTGVLEPGTAASVMRHRSVLYDSDYTRLPATAVMCLRTALHLRELPIPIDWDIRPASWFGELVLVALSVLGPIQAALVALAVRRYVKR